WLRRPSGIDNAALEKTGASRLRLAGACVSTARHTAGHQEAGGGCSELRDEDAPCDQLIFGHVASPSFMFALLRISVRESGNLIERPVPSRAVTRLNRARSLRRCPSTKSSANRSDK